MVTFTIHETWVDLIFLDMIDLDTILDTDWLAPYHVILDCYAKIVTLAMLEVSRLAWKSMLNLGMKSVVSFLRACCIIKRGYLSYIAYIYNTSATLPPPIDSIRVVQRFIRVFPMDFPV